MAKGMAKSLEIYYQGERVAVIEDGSVVSSDFETEGWDEYARVHGKEWTIELEIIDLDWDETWLVAYMGRMYANYFKS